MDAETKEALAGFDRAVEWLKRQREAGWSPLSDQYLAHIERVEALPQNQSGADKSWVWTVAARDRNHFARARRRR